MPAPRDPDSDLLAEGGLPGTLIELKDQIFDRFVAAVRESVPAGRNASRPLIVNTLPGFVTSLALALSPSSPRRIATDGSSVAQTHGEERATLTGYELDDLLHEYQILRWVLLDLLSERMPLTPAQTRTIIESVDQAIREATAAFVHVYDTLRNQVAATLTHDLRGPLGAAVNYVHLIQRGGDSPVDRSRYCEGALRNLNRVRQMIDDLLDHSRAGAGERLQLRLAPLDLRPLLEEVLVDLRAAHGDRFHLKAPDRVDGVWCADALKRAVFNLAENAIKYGDRTLPVTVNLETLQGGVYISVHNFGPPIPDAERESLFSPFRRGSTASQGWGLGLTAVKEIAAAHGGSVTVESAAEEGTTFTLQIFQDARKFVEQDVAR